MASTLIAPTPITIPFAASGSKNTIPTTSQVGVVDGAASYPDGFPPLCGTPLESGGKPPSRADMNGILHGITENLRYLLGGCIPKFNATLAAAIGGYPLGARVQDNSGANCYRNLVDGNSIDFNTTPASIGVSWELVYGPGKTVQSATTSAQGVVELATIAEAKEGESSSVAVTPAGLAASSPPQILSISASVAVNSLTLALNPTQITFRSADLADGEVNKRQVSSPVTITVPSGSTLGTANGQIARLVVIAIDDAGTVELAVVNMSGGNNLDEATLINTTAIGMGGSANSSNVVYSTSAKSGVPFRVVGFVDISETTAGVWAAAPIKVQGAGGLSVAAFSSVGYGQRWHQFSIPGERSIGTTYYNTSGKPIQLGIGAVGDNSVAQLQINGIAIGQVGTSGGSRAELSGIVPAGGSYRVIATSGTPTIETWAELL